MNRQLSDLEQRIAALSDDELVTMAGTEADSYRPEALEIARRELERRGFRETRGDETSAAAVDETSAAAGVEENHAAGVEEIPSPSVETSGPWKCPKCRTVIEADYQTCWNCGTAADGTEDPLFRRAEESRGVPPAEGDRPACDHGVSFEVFRGGLLTSWENLFQQAATFASQFPPDRLIGISHSGDAEHGIVTVWYRLPEVEED